MRKYILLSLLALLNVMLFTSCDEHYHMDVNIHPGDVLCDNHVCMRVEDYLSQDKSSPSFARAVGVVFAEPSEENPYIMAVLLQEIVPMQVADTLGYIQGTSQSLTAFDGTENTVALQASYDEKTLHGSPLATYLFRYHQWGQSDYLPSVAETRILAAHVSLVNNTIRQVGGDPISLVSEGGACWYWTSTECSTNPGSQVWLVSMVNGSIKETPKDERHPARAIVRINMGNINN